MANVPQSFANNANTTLSTAALAGDASIVVASATGFPSTTPYTILVESELMLVTSGATTTTWGVSRGQEGTAAAAHAATVPISQEFTKAGLDSLGQGYWPYLSPGGVTGAAQQTRYMGATTSGAPGSGAFQVGDFIIDQTGTIWICRTAGSPGTWVGSQSTRAHFLSTAPGPPTLTAPNAGVNTSSMGAGSTDTRGTVNLGISASTPITPGSGIITVNFASAYANANYAVVLSGDTNANGGGMAVSPYTKTASSFRLWLSGTTNMAVSLSYSFDYIVIG
jgi:hypothetical protein